MIDPIDDLIQAQIEFRLPDIVGPVEAQDIRLGVLAESQCKRLERLAESARKRCSFGTGPMKICVNPCDSAEAFGVAPR